VEEKHWIAGEGDSGAILEFFCNSSESIFRFVGSMLGATIQLVEWDPSRAPILLVKWEPGSAPPAEKLDSDGFERTLFD
jgi:hypothetical protein